MVATGLEPVLAALGQVRNRRDGALSLTSLLCSPRFRLAASPTGRTSAPRPIDVNDVLWAIGQVVKLKYGREHTSEALEIWAFSSFGLCSRRMCSGCVQLCSLALNTGVFSCVQSVFTASMCSFFAEHGHEKA